MEDDRIGGSASRKGARGAVAVDVLAGLVGGAAAAGTVVMLVISDSGRLRWPLVFLFAVLACAAVVRATRGTPKPFRFTVTVVLLTAVFVGASWQPWGGPWVLIPVVVVFACAEARHRYGTRRYWTAPPDRAPQGRAGESDGT